MIKLLVIARARKTFPRFWSKVNFHGPVPEHRPDLGACWLWMAGNDGRHGYGHFKLDGKWHKSHRLAYELLVGPIPTVDPTCPARPMSIDHLCRNPACVNPVHMEVVTQRENVRRGRVGEFWANKTYCPHGHSYSGDNLRITPDGKRKCRACNREGLRRARERA